MVGGDVPGLGAGNCAYLVNRPQFAGIPRVGDGALLWITFVLPTTEEQLVSPAGNWADRRRAYRVVRLNSALYKSPYALAQGIKKSSIRGCRLGFFEPDGTGERFAKRR